MRGLYANYLSLLRYSERDTLTGLLNRKTFDESLQQVLTASAARRCEQPEADGAPRPAAGQLAGGDGHRPLQARQRQLRPPDRRRGADPRRQPDAQGVPPQDKLFRFGGEEFVVLLRDTAELHALKALERFRQTVEQHEFPQLGHVTVCIGVTRVQAFDNPTTLLGRADEALYYAKKHGRNQMQFFDSLAAEGKITHTPVMHTEAVLF